MKISVLQERGILNECTFTFVRSRGPGGQNVNKVNTKVEFRFNIAQSLVLSEEEKLLIFNKLKKKINRDGEIIITSQTGRSQLQNKLLTIEKFFSLLEKAFSPDKKRIPTAPSQSSKLKRIENKRKHSEKKKFRTPPEFDI